MILYNHEVTKLCDQKLWYQHASLCGIDYGIGGTPRSHFTGGRSLIASRHTLSGVPTAAKVGEGGVPCLNWKRCRGKVYSKGQSIKRRKNARVRLLTHACVFGRVLCVLCILTTIWPLLPPSRFRVLFFTSQHSFITTTNSAGSCAYYTISGAVSCYLPVRHSSPTRLLRPTGL